MNFKYGLLALGASAIFALFGSSTYALDTPTTETDGTIIVTVQPGDYLSAIAEKYNVTYVDLFNANDFIGNPDLIHVGDKIRIPAKDEQLPQRFEAYQQEISNYGTATYNMPSTSPSSTPTTNYRATSSGNTYAWGNCTWYVKNRRPDLPNMLGNGGQWVANAAARGYTTGSSPRVGAVAEGPGHVMYVESVHDNGTITVSEMNYNGGIGVVHTRTISSAGLRFIY